MDTNLFELITPIRTGESSLCSSRHIFCKGGHVSEGALARKFPGVPMAGAMFFQTEYVPECWEIVG